MKQCIFSTLLLVNVSVQQCGKAAVASIPACIQAKIEAIKKQPRWNPPARVEEYIYNGKRVFLFSSNCCDQFNQAFDEACHPVCAPSGGMTGKGDRQCPDFDANAKLVRLVWKDERQ